MSAQRLWMRFERRSGEWRWCLRWNRWAAQRAAIGFFRHVSRLGDGVFWYALMLAMAATGGANGRSAALHMALTGAVAALLYRALKRWTRRPRPFRAHDDDDAPIAQHRIHARRAGDGHWRAALFAGIDAFDGKRPVGLVDRRLDSVDEALDEFDVFTEKDIQARELPRRDLFFERGQRDSGHSSEVLEN